MREITRGSFVRNVAAVAGAAALVPSAVRAADPLTPINVAAIPADISGLAYYAADAGFFAKNGLVASFIPLANGGAISSAVLGGSADVGYSNVVSLALAHERGLPVTIIAPANLHVHDAPTVGIMAVKKTSPYREARDLNGKIIAVIGLNNIADVAVKAWLAEDGADVKSVKLVELPFSEMKAALEAGRIDAGAIDQTGDPLLGKPGDTLRVIGNAFDAVAHRFLPSVWFTTTDFIAKHPATAKAFVTAMREAAVWANTHHAQSAVILAKYTHDTPEQIQSITRVTYGDRLSPDLIQPDIDAAVKYGPLKTVFPASDLIAHLG